MEKLVTFNKTTRFLAEEFRWEQQQLVGVLHMSDSYAPKEGFPIVIICHGFNGNKSQRKFVELARELCRNKINVLRFDFSGNGDSEGNFEKMTIEQEVRDLNVAIASLLNHGLSGKKIGIVGYSLGALIATLAILPILEENTLKKIDISIGALAFLAPALNQKALVKEWHTPSQIRRWKKLGYHDTDKFRIGLQYLKEIENKDFTGLAAKLNLPTLIVQGTKDDTVKPKYAKELFKVLKGEKKLKLIKGGDHNLEKYDVKKEMIEETVKWFKKYL